MEDPDRQPEAEPWDPDRLPPDLLDPDPADDALAPSPEAVADQLRHDILAIHLDSYGRTAQNAAAHVLEDIVVVVLDGLELLPNEEFMIERGRPEVVRHVRDQYQKAIEPTFRAAVERATGRRVTGFASHSQVEEEPRFVVEVFRLEPQG